MSATNPLEELVSRLNLYVEAQSPQVREIAESVLALRSFSESPAYDIALRRPQVLVDFAHAQVMLYNPRLRRTGSETASDISPASVSEMRNLIEIHIHRLQEQHQPRHAGLLYRPVEQVTTLTEAETRYILATFTVIVRTAIQRLDPELVDAFEVHDADGYLFSLLTGSLVSGQAIDVSEFTDLQITTLRNMLHDTIARINNGQLGALIHALSHFRQNPRHGLPGGRERLPRPFVDIFDEETPDIRVWDTLSFPAQDMAYFLVHFVDDHSIELSDEIRRHPELFYIFAALVEAVESLGVSRLVTEQERCETMLERIRVQNEHPGLLPAHREHIGVIEAGVRRLTIDYPAAWSSGASGLRWLHGMEVMPDGDAAQWNAGWVCGYVDMYAHHRSQRFRLLTLDVPLGPVGGAPAEPQQVQSTARAEADDNNGDGGDDDDDWTKSCLYCCKKFREPHESASTSSHSELKHTLPCCGGTVGTDCFDADCSQGRRRCPLCNSDL